MLENSMVCMYIVATFLAAIPTLNTSIPDRPIYAAMVCMYALGCVLCVVLGWTVTLYLSAGGAALYAWLWWHKGGGDDTKRRLKRWAGRFQGVRRTAPTAS